MSDTLSDQLDAFVKNPPTAHSSAIALATVVLVNRLSPSTADSKSNKALPFGLVMGLASYYYMTRVAHMEPVTLP